MSFARDAPHRAAARDAPADRDVPLLVPPSDREGGARMSPSPSRDLPVSNEGERHVESPRDAP
ncbi:hypothetical protein, partial [Burkholderia oklahomensis]|uniref:hypothetical protein n=1 Tax=Burkholderia oklahomensis TaxID=342113 RepID=UPI001E48E34C